MYSTHILSTFYLVLSFLGNFTQLTQYSGCRRKCGIILWNCCKFFQVEENQSSSKIAARHLKYKTKNELGYYLKTKKLNMDAPKYVIFSCLIPFWYVYSLKVWQIQNEFMKTSIFQISNSKILRISVLKVYLKLNQKLVRITLSTYYKPMPGQT